MGDYLKTLPTDSTVATVNELNVINSLFVQQKKTLKTIFVGVKDIIIAGILFFILTLPFINNLIGGCINFVNTSPLVMSIVKTLIFMVLFFFVQNIMLAKK